MSKRRGFTLVEMLVAVAIIIVLLGIVLYFLPKRETVATRDSAGKIEAYLSGAKAMAMRENRLVSVRLLTNDNGQTFTGALYVDNGEPFAPIDQPYYNWQHGAGGNPPALTTYIELPNGLAIQAANQNANPAVTGNTVRQVGVNLTGIVVVGDQLEIHENTPSIHKIEAIDYATGTLTLAASKKLIEQNGNGIWEPALNEYWQIEGVPNVSSTASGVRLPFNYRYLRSPRPLMGEQGIQFNKDVYIHGTTQVGTNPARSLNIPRGRLGDWEITFSPSGQVVGNTGRIVLWIADTNNVAKPVLLCIYPTSGMKSEVVGPPGNEFQHTADGK